MKSPKVGLNKKDFAVIVITIGKSRFSKNHEAEKSNNDIK